jgi:YidC/Oxa1 family membrane protein insertase
VDRNLLLAIALSLVVLSTWSMWQERQLKEAPPRGISEAVQREPAADEAKQPDYLELPPAEPVGPPVPSVDRDPYLDEPPADPGQVIPIERELYHAELDARGAVIRHWELGEQYRDFQGGPVVLADASVGSGKVGATPFRELGVGDLSREIWEVEREDSDSVVFRIERDGVEIRKSYTFDPDTYAFRLLVEVNNGSDGVAMPRFLVDWPARLREGRDFQEQALAVLQDGSVEIEQIAGLGSAGFMGSLTGSPPKKSYSYGGEIDWAGVQTNYFLSALLPDSPTQANARFLVVEPAQAGLVQVFFDPLQLPPGQSAAREFRGYLGPKESDRLEKVGGGLIESIDLGWSWVAPLTRLFGWLLSALYAVVGNYGVAIIILTILVRLVTAPLTMKQMRSMERMRRLQPRIKEIQEKFSDDRQRQSEEMMRLYKQEKVNPLGGCLPMILQLPVFIGLFYALRSSIHLRQAPFVGWIDDLSAPDMLFEIPGVGLPVRVLPLVMGATMVVQQKITPMQMDPAQARMMMTIMPIMMTVLFYQFPSGLVLYWMLSNVLAIAHQLWVGRKMQPAAARSD